MRVFPSSLALLLVLLGSSPASPGQWRLASTRNTPFEIRGAAASAPTSGSFFTWGSAVHIWENGIPRRVAASPEGFDGGGCVFDADRDGHADLILSRRREGSPLGDLVWLPSPDFRPRIIDTDVELHDCLPATLYGRRGFLIIHRHTQIRFYQVPEKRSQPWPMREIYSIYTASRQAGLAVADVNADGLPDIYCGNYWAQAPPSFDLPWHVFAINAHYAAPEDASFTFAATLQILFAAQKEHAQTPLRIFRRPPDPRHLWPESQAAGPRLRYPSALLLHDGMLFAADATGLRAFHTDGSPAAAWPSEPIRKLFVSGNALVAAGAHFVSVWRR